MSGLATRRKVRVYIPEQDLEYLLAYWAKGEAIPAEFVLTSFEKPDSPGEMLVGPGGRPIRDMKDLAKRWLSEERMQFRETKETLEVTSSLFHPVTLTFGDKVHISCKVELGRETTSWLRGLEGEDAKAFLNEIKAVLALKPCEFAFHGKSGLPTGFEVSSVIYHDGFTKDRMMSVMSEVSRTASLALTVTEMRFEHPVSGNHWSPGDLPSRRTEARAD